MSADNLFAFYRGINLTAADRGTGDIYDSGRPHNRAVRTAHIGIPDRFEFATRHITTCKEKEQQLPLQPYAKVTSTANWRIANNFAWPHFEL